MIRRPTRSTRPDTLFPYTTLFRSHRRLGGIIAAAFARDGYSLAIHGSHDTRLDSHLVLALEENATEWEGFTVDFSDPEGAAELVALVADSFRRARSDERRVGKECGSTCRSRVSRYHKTKDT